MELIKKIKQAEAQARQIVEQAKSQVSEQAKNAQANRLDILTQGEQERKKTIETAVSTGRSQALAEIENLKAQAEENRSQLREKTDSKMASAVQRVLEHIKE